MISPCSSSALKTKNALAAFNSKRAEIMNIEINRLREATNVLNA